ncbi:MAG: Hpt domain-containing protein [Clostridiales bacterium]|jgi:HPt (histidine-containing phosphotransfer) domain-containing protein|nr:Hpt domain-containing protein [Clostridiales bacterium]
MAELVWINLEEGLGRMRGNETLYKKLLNIFLSSPEFDALEEALNADDTRRAVDVAHGIKGMTGNLSLTALFEGSTKLMNELRAGLADPATVAAYRDILKKTREEVKAYLSR